MPAIPPNSLFSAFSFIGFLLAGLPLPWHIQTCNTGTCMYMLWTSLGCLILFVNSVVWDDNTTNWAPVWCDISGRYLIGASVGIPASSLCIVRRLYYITKLQVMSVGKKERRREVAIDMSIGVGFPCIVMTLHYIVQGHRFDIFEQLGCYFSIINTLAAYFLVFMWPLVIGLISLVYALLTFRRAFHHQEQLKRTLESGFHINSRRYWLLMALCTVESVFTIPLSLYVMIVNAVGHRVVPYVSWHWIHDDFSRVGQYSVDFWQKLPGVAISLETTRWLYILCAFVIFAFFGWGPEVRDFYPQAFRSVCRRLGFSKPSSASHASTAWKPKRQPKYPDEQILPVYDTDRPVIPLRARMKSDFARTSLSFEAPPRSECGSVRLSVDEELVDTSPSLQSLKTTVHHVRDSLSMPERALARDRRLHPVTPNQDQLV